MNQLIFKTWYEVEEEFLTQQKFNRIFLLKVKST
jgi:hypothetical protein